ncbi:MAG: response regulator [Spirochaetales bacterium]|nr:response regulator [Spirochaetales bacterium]
MSQSSLQQDFETETIQRSIRQVKLSAVVSSIAFMLFNILDYFMYPDLYTQLLVIRLGVVVLNIGVFFLVRTSLGSRHPREIAMFEYLIYGLSIVLMIHLAGGYISPYYAGINIVLFGFIFILPLDVVRTAIVCALIYIAYLGPILLSQEISDFAIFLNNNFFLVCTTLLAILTSHLSTQMRFKEFSSRYSLAEANDELKKLDVLKSQFFANVSHEVRTPLTSIISPIQSLYQGDIGEMAPEQSRLVSQMYRNSLKLLDMINQMLDFSKFEAGKMELRLGAVDLDETVRDIMAVFEDVTERKGIKLGYVRETNIPPVYLDADKIERILMNLLRNAIKFTESGSITVRTGRKQGSIMIEVEDTGIGIPRDHLPDIFKRFQQVDTSSTRRYEGTGLGLTIVKEAVELMKGNIQAFSEEGKGTRFLILLPDNLDKLVPDAFIERRYDERRKLSLSFGGEERRKSERRKADLSKVSVDDLALIERELYPVEPADERYGETVPAGDTDVVLLVEDNADLRHYVSKMLKRFGHDVITAQDGLDGWHRVRNDHPDIIVTDVMMPRMDGFELVSKMKSDENTMHIPVILITAKHELDSKIEGLKTGADDYLSKPVNIRELDARIKNLLTMRKFQLALARTEELKTRMEELSMSFSQSLEMRDSKTAGHSRDVLSLGTMIAEEIGLEVDQVLRDSLLLHDIGKLGIPDRILLKESSLSEEEWEVMKTHSELGANLLGNHESYREVSRIVLAHQEHFDGTGYPNGLKGREIPLNARIIAIADAYHAMTSDRPYRRALSPSTAARELLKHSGSQFDPKLVKAFIDGLLKRGEISKSDLQVARARVRS